MALDSGLRILLQCDPGFPGLLLEIPDPPVMLYLKGRLPGGPALSIVGSRRATGRGRETARRFAAEAARAGVVVVSGLAYGIDASAHAGAVDAHGESLAILAGGLDRPGPRGNLGLAGRILARGGGWISEHPPGVSSRAHHFPDRNRLISGLGRATLVVEARERSGTLWTARHAADQGREVFVVPGPIDTEACRGSNGLLREGANLALGPDDILERFDGLLRRPVLPDPVEPRPAGDAARVLRQLDAGPCGPDELIERLGLSAERLAALLVEMELDGSIHRVGRRITRTREFRS